MKHEKVVGLLIILLFLLAAIPVRVKAQQQPAPFVTLNLLIYAGSPTFLAIANSIKVELAKLGIDVEIHPFETGTFVSRTDAQAGPKMLTYDEGGFDMSMHIWDYYPTDYVWYVGGYVSASSPPNGWQFWQGNDAVADQHLINAMSSYNQTYRKQEMWAWQEAFYENMDLIGIAHPEQALMDDRKVSNYDPVMMSYDIDNWNITGATPGANVTIRFATENPSNMLNPLFMDGGYEYLDPQFRALYRTLRSPDGKYTVAPDMATGYSISNDGLSVTFKLRKDIKWSDGYPFTAQDVKMTYDAILDPATGASFTSDFSDAVKSVEMPDNYTIVLHLNKAAPHILQLVQMPSAMIVPYHVLGMVPHAKWRTDPTNTVAPPPGTGPMKFVSWSKAEYMQLEPNPYFYGRKNGITTYVVDLIPDATTAFSSLAAGKVDILRGEYASVSPGDVKNLMNNTALHIEPWPAIADLFLAMNWNVPFLNNKYVRWAIASAIPYDHIINDIMFGLAVRSPTQVVPSTWGYNPNVPNVNYSLDTARDFLSKAGYVWPPPVVQATQDTTTLMFYLVAGIVVGAIVGSGLGFFVSRRKYAIPVKEE